MLDQELSWHPRPHPFTASYIECRVNKEPRDGDPGLLCIRQVAEQLTTNTQTRADYIARLCTLAGPKIGCTFHLFKKAWRPTSESEAFLDHLQVAAVYLNHLAEVDLWGAPMTKSTMFGSCLELCVRSGSMDMLERYLRGEHATNRSRLLPKAAMLGRLDMVEFIHNYEIETTPWCFESGPGSGVDSNALKRGLWTPNPVVWEYIMGLHRHYGRSFRVTFLKALLFRYASRGWTDTARYLLDQYARGKIPMHREEAYITSGTEQDSAPNPADTLVQWDNNRILMNAISNGRLDYVQLLLEHSCDTKGAVAAAARCGYVDIVRVLLQSGADVNEDMGDLSAVCYAVLLENTSMFYYLIEHGANVPSATMREDTAKRAKISGVESMLGLLDSWSLAPKSTDAKFSL
jgi:hypothetical protein